MTIRLYDDTSASQHRVNQLDTILHDNFTMFSQEASENEISCIHEAAPR